MSNKTHLFRYLMLSSFILLLLFVPTAFASPQPTSNFTGNVTSGYNPLTVQFTDTSTNYPTSWSWNFGDNTTSTQQNPVHTYNSVGTFNVTLIASNVYGDNTTTKTSYITINKTTPSINWSSPIPVTYPYQLSSTQLNATANVTGSFTYTPSLGANLQAGNYTLNCTFTPTDAANYTTATASVNFTVNKWNSIITWNPSPINFTYGYALNPGQLSASGGAASGAFSFKYNNTTCTYGQILPAGSNVVFCYLVPYDTTDFTNNSTQRTFTVSKATPVITWNTPSQITYPAALNSTQLNATCSVAGSFSYNPASGTVLHAGIQILNVTFTPNDTANYTTSTASVNLTVNKWNSIITWNPNPTNFTYGYPLNPGQLSASGGAASGAFSFKYNNTTCTYGQILPVGSDVVVCNLVPYDTTDFTNNSTQRTFTVSKAIPIVSWVSPPPILYLTPLSGTQLNATSSINGSFVYNPALGTVLPLGTNTLNVTFTPTDSANYSSSNGSTSITVYQASPISNFSANITTGIVPLTIQFTDNSTGFNNTYQWSFGDGSTNSTQQNPIHVYPFGNSNYTVIETVTNSGGTNTIQKTSYVTTHDPIPIVEFSVNTTRGTYPQTVQFTDPTIGENITSYHWDFGDGTYSDIENPEHTFAAGIYNVTASATNNGGTGTLTKNEYIIISQSTPTIIWNKPEDIVYNTPLSGTQLNANADVQGIYNYTYKIPCNITGTSYKCANWTSEQYPSVNILGQIYVPVLVKDDPLWESYVNKLSKLVVDSDVPYTLATGESLNIGNGYSIQIKQVDIAGQKVWVELDKDGQYVDDQVVATDSGDHTWTSNLDKIGGIDGVDVFKIYISGISHDDVKGDVAQINGMWLIDYQNTTTYNIGDYVNGNELVTINSGTDASNLGNFVYHSPEIFDGTILSAGSHDLHVDFTPNDYNNYSNASADVILNVNQVVPTITWNQPQYIVYGAPLNNTQLDAVASVSGTYIYTPPIGTILNVGNQPLHVDFTPDDITNYTTASQDTTIIVNNAPRLPIANFNANKTSGYVPLVVKFTDTSQYATGWQWNFADGTANSTQQSPTHTFTTAGSRRVVLTVSNSNGTSSKATTLILTSHGATRPVANFDVNVTNGTVPFDVKFNDTSINTPTSWSWDFGDGATSTIQNPAHTYTTSGNYTVTLVATNSAGAGNITKTDVILATAIPTINWSTPTDIVYGTPLSGTQLNATASVDGMYNYTPPAGTVLGVGNWILNVDFNPTDNLHYLNTSTNVTINVISPILPIANFSTNKTNGVIPLVIQFTDMSQHATSWQWNFGDDTTNSTEPNPVHVYISGNHNYTVTETVMNSNGTNTIQKINYVNTFDPIPIVEFSANVTNITYPQAIQFIDPPIGDNITNYNWDFGDGSYSDLEEPTHTYTAGTYNVTENIINNGGIGTLTRYYYINVAQATPVINWSAPDDIIYGTPLSNTQLNASADVQGTYNYDPPLDTILSAGSNNLHVDFSPTDDTNYSDVSADVNINVTLLTPTITWSNPANITYGTPLGDTQLDAVASTQGNFTYDPPIGTILDIGTRQLNVTFTPNDTTNYTMAYANTIINVTVPPLLPVANFNSNVSSGYVPLTVQFTDSSLYATSWQWRFGDGTANSTQQNPVHTFVTTGTRTVILTVINANGTDSKSKQIIVRSHGPAQNAPIAGFTANVSEGEVPLTVQFTDASMYATSWLWNFGDGNTSTEQSPIHTFTSVGTYNITQSVFNTYGNNSQSGDIIVDASDPIDVTLSQKAGSLSELNPVDINATGVTAKTATNPLENIILSIGSNFTLGSIIIVILGAIVILRYLAII